MWFLRLSPLDRKQLIVRDQEYLTPNLVLSGLRSPDSGILGPVVG